MNLLPAKKVNGAIEKVLLRGTQSKTRKSNLLSGLQNTLTGLKEEESILHSVRSEVEEIMVNLRAEDELFMKELASISAVRSNIEKLLGSEGNDQ